MTDERIGERLWSAIERLPNGAAGIVLRHYSLAARAREELAQQIADLAKCRRLTLAVAADEQLAAKVGAALVHNPTAAPRQLPFSRSVHKMSEAEAACAQGAALLFVSPVHATRSHPGEAPLGPELATRIAKAVDIPAIALGGVNAQNFAQLADAFYGWAGIDAWI